MSSEKPPIKILCVDDEADILEVHNSILLQLGYEIILATNGEDAFRLIETHSENLAMVISDYSMPGWTGFDLRKAMLENYVEIPFILISAQISREAAIKAIELKLSGFLEKPYGTDDFLSLVKKEMAHRVSAIQDEYELLIGFTVEADGMLDEMESLALSLENDPDDGDAIDRIFACAHTIKGTSGFFKPNYVQTFTHHFEDYLSKFKKHKETVEESHISIILKSLDTIRKLVLLLKNRDHDKQNIEELSEIFLESSHLPQKSETQKKSAPKTANKNYSKGPEELKVAISLLDRFMEMSGEITVLRNMINKMIKVVEAAYPGDQNITTLRELLSEMHKVNTSMQNQVLDLRKVPLKQTFKPLIRTLRDLNTQLEKKIQLDVSGDELRVDHSIAEILNKCLIHLLRNSADHGIEKEGKISLIAEEKNDSIIVKLADNGRGINPDAVKLKCLEKGLINSAQADTMTRSQIQLMIFEPGFSTADTVTDVSGRGVGTDMVKKTVESGNGRIELQSEPGLGTEFTLHLPVPKSVMIISSLLVKSGGLTFAIPQDEILKVNLMDNDFILKNIKNLGGSLFLQDNEKIIPVINLATIYHLENQTSGYSNLITIHTNNYTFCILVDEVLETEDIVVKKLGPWFNRLNFYTGATFLGDGKIGLILNTESIMLCFNDKIEKNHRNEAPLTKNNLQDDPVSTLLLFNAGSKNLFGLNQSEIFRLESFSLSDIQYTGKQPIIIYRGQATPLFEFQTIIENNKLRKNCEKRENESFLTIIYLNKDRYMGFIVKNILDFVKTSISPEKHLHPYIIDDKTITFIKMEELVSSLEFLEHDDTLLLTLEKSISL